MKRLVVLISALGISASALAKTEIAPQIEKLKTNAENSEYNYKQYQDNLDIVNRNIDQATKAEKDLQSLEKQLLLNVKNVEKNKAALTKQELEIQQFKKKELEKISVEEKQMADLQKLMNKIQANVDQRKKNVQTYDQKVADISAERKAWDTQVQEMASLQTEIQKKQKLAQQEKSKWVGKRKDYEQETKKWKTQAANHKSTYDRYK